MVRLSVNVNKVATVRNSRGADAPSVVAAVAVAVEAGAPGITVHPRADARHIRVSDVCEISAYLSQHPDVEFNVEGDPRPDLIDLVCELRPQQCTLVPVLEGEVTSQGGWPTDTDDEELGEVVARLKAEGIRTSVFIDAVPEAVEWVKSLGADRVELYTEPYARAFVRGEEAAKLALEPFYESSEHAEALGLGVNAGHDLDLHNLSLFKSIPFLDEVSIGHALISQALFDGLGPTVKKYLDLLAAK